MASRRAVPRQAWPAGAAQRSLFPRLRRFESATNRRCRTPGAAIAVRRQQRARELLVEALLPVGGFKKRTTIDIRRDFRDAPARGADIQMSTRQPSSTAPQATWLYSFAYWIRRNISPAAPMAGSAQLPANLSFGSSWGLLLIDDKPLCRDHSRQRSSQVSSPSGVTRPNAENRSAGRTIC